MGTLDAENCRINGGVVPVGNTRRIVWLIAVTCATAASIRTPGWKKTLITEIPDTDCDSMCSMSLTVVVMARSLMVVKRFSISSGLVPLYCQMMVTTGMSMSGKMSVDMVTMETVPSKRIS